MGHGIKAPRSNLLNSSIHPMSFNSPLLKKRFLQNFLGIIAIIYTVSLQMSESDHIETLFKKKKKSEITDYGPDIRGLSFQHTS